MSFFSDSMVLMFLRVTNRRKDGKAHRYYSVVENRRVRGGKHVQKTVLYLGEINDTQKASWTRTIDAIDECEYRQVALFPEDREIPEGVDLGVQVRLSKLQLDRPRQWGACRLGCELWDRLALGEFWRERQGASRKGTEWRHVLQTLVCYRLIDPGSEWRLHRYWFDHSAMVDLLGEDFKIAQKDTLYRCHDRLLKQKEDLFRHLKSRWETLFDARCEVRLYDLTSTYFESAPPFDDKRQFGYSRDKRSDCVQVVIALFRSIQLVEVWFDTVDEKRICLPQITRPESEHQAILDQIKWPLPKQPPPRIYAPGRVREKVCWRLASEIIEFSKDFVSRILYLRNSG